MAEDLNGFFSSVLTTGNISSVPIPDATFQEAKSYCLEQFNNIMYIHEISDVNQTSA